MPTTLIAVIWIGIGLSFGRLFGKNLDHQLQETEWFKQLPVPVQFILERVLDALHHWWIGGLLMLSFQVADTFLLGPLIISPFWFGMGLFIDDLPDVPPRIKDMFSYWFETKK